MYLNNSPKITLNQKICLFIIATVDLMSFCTISILSLFVSQEAVSRGEVIHLFGADIGYTTFINLVASLLFGKIVPKLGAKNVFLGAVILSRTCTIVFGTLQHFGDGSYLTLIAYILKGLETLGSCAYFIAGYAIVFTMFTEEVGLIRAILETVAGIGTNIGPSIGKIFLLSVQQPDLPFYVVGISVISLVVAGSCVIDNVKDIHQNTGSLKSFFNIPNTPITCTVIFIVSLTTNCIEFAGGEFFCSDSIFFKNSAYLKLTIAIAFAVSNPIWAYISDQAINPSWMMPTGLYFAGMSITILPFHKRFQNYMFDILILCLVGIATAMALAPTFRCLTLGALDQGFKNTLTTHSSVCAAWSFTFALGEILGPGFGRFLLNAYNFTTVCALMATINISTAILCTSYLYNRVRNRNVCCCFSFKFYFQ